MSEEMKIFFVEDFQDSHCKKFKGGAGCGFRVLFPLFFKKRKWNDCCGLLSLLLHSWSSFLAWKEMGLTWTDKSPSCQSIRRLTGLNALQEDRTAGRFIIQERMSKLITIDWLSVSIALFLFILAIGFSCIIISSRGDRNE